jgi:hypothetical protein
MAIRRIGSNSLDRSRVVMVEEAAMPTYRAYLIDSNNRVVSFKPVEAGDDDEALQAAQQFVDGRDIEVWHLDRMIGRIGAKAAEPGA